MAIHHFKPSHYHNTIGSHEPVLRINDGDTVITTTLDASGRDANDEQVAPRVNPQSGPFYIEGAEPGDTLAVVLDSIEPNRERGWSATVLSENVLDPWYVRELPPQAMVDWHVDRAARTATLLPSGDLTLPLDPMIGCLGVAPDLGQAISTATSGAHGGNMDYRGFRAGTTAYFPVFVPGALFHLGDGHALQGDGEIAGTGIEISMDVRFTVHLLKGRRSHWPRGENSGSIFTVGNARPLDQCVQHATTEMVRWLEEEYGLDVVASNTLMGQSVRYDLGNIFNPAYTMICRMPKSLLPSPRR